MIRLSAFVCVQNQDARLAECLRKLSFCDEIVVVADRCTDRTQDIARQFGARVIDGIFPLESQRKAAGLAACLGEWILEVEPDETVEHALAYEVRAAIHSRPDGDWFDVPMENFVGETLVQRGWGAGLGVASAVRLYRRRVKHWKAGRIEPAAILDGKSAGALETPLQRRTDADVGQMFARLNQQAALRAQDIADAGQPKGLASDIGRGLRQFWTCYVWRQGLREGELGFMISLLAALEPILAGVRARDLVKARGLVQAAPATQAQPTRIGRAG